MESTPARTRAVRCPSAGRRAAPRGETVGMNGDPAGAVAGLTSRAERRRRRCRSSGSRHGARRGSRRSRCSTRTCCGATRAPRTRRAYLRRRRGSSRAGRASQGLAPADVGPKDVRRYVAHLSAAGSRAEHLARASWRRCGRCSTSLREHGHDRAEPRRARRPRRGAARHLPRVLSAREAARLLDAIPAASPLELRDRAMFELAYSCGLRAEELVSLRLRATSTTTPSSCASRARAARRAWCPSASPRMAAVRAYLERARGGAQRRRGGAPEPARCSSARPAAGALSTSDVRRGCGSWSVTRRRRRGASPRTRCATASPPTCSTAAPTCAASRRCSATRASRAPRSTLG